MDAVVLERADHLQARAVADVGEPRITMPAEVSLEDPAVVRAVEDGAPRFQLAHAVRRFLRVELGHAPVVDVLPAAHRVGEVDAPVVAVVDVAHGGGHAALGHDGVGLAQQRLADQPDRTPAADASIAARSPAPPAPMISTSCSCVTYSGIRWFSGAGRGSRDGRPKEPRAPKCNRRRHFHQKCGGEVSGRARPRQAGPGDGTGPLARRSPTPGVSARSARATRSLPHLSLQRVGRGFRRRRDGERPDLTGGPRPPPRTPGAGPAGRPSRPPAISPLGTWRRDWPRRRPLGSAAGSVSPDQLETVPAIQFGLRGPGQRPTRARRRSCPRPTRAAGRQWAAASSMLTAACTAGGPCRPD